MPRFPISPPWRWVVTDRQSSVLTFLDRLASSREVDYPLDAPASSQLTVPSESPEVNIIADVSSIDGEPFVSNNDRLLYGFRRDAVDASSVAANPWTVRFAGILMQPADSGDAERALTTITAFDPWQYLYSRPVVIDADGTLPSIDGYLLQQTPAGLIAAALLADSIASAGDCYIDAGLAYGGTAYWAGTIELGGIVDINFQRGLSIGEAWAQLCATGAIDIVLTPVYDPINRPGILADLSIYGEAGSVRDEAVFAWDRPSRSLVKIDRLTDGAKLMNNAQYFAGQGGIAVPFQFDAASIAQYGNYWETRAIPGGSSEEWQFAVAAYALEQVDLRSHGLTTVSFDPAPERSPDPFREYWLGDRVPVYASNRLRLPIPAGSQVDYVRVYGVSLAISDDGVEQPKLTLSAQGA